MKDIIDSYTNDLKRYLLSQKDFSGKYQLTTKSSFVTRKSIPPVNVSAITSIDFLQIVDRKKITSRLSFTEISSESDNINMSEGIKEYQPFTKITPVIEVTRNMDGKVLNISNISEIKADWEIWKHEQMPKLFPDKIWQLYITSIYEAAIKSMEDNFDNFDDDLQYQLLLPECYNFSKNPDIHEMGSTKTYHSRLIKDFELFYCFEKKSFSDDDSIVKINLGILSDVEEEEKEEQLIAFYKKALPDFSCKDYLFDVNIEYTFDKHTSEIIYGKLSFIEQLHPNFVYTIEMELTKQEEKPNKI